MTMGFTHEWQQTNVAAPVGPSGLVEARCLAKSPFRRSASIISPPQKHLRSISGVKDKQEVGCR
jgi:hypothetical protein